MENITILKGNEGKQVVLFETKKVSGQQVFQDGTSLAHHYERNGISYEAKIISVEGDNITSKVIVECPAIWGNGVTSEYYGSIGWDVRDSNMCARICNEHYVYEIEVK